VVRECTLQNIPVSAEDASAVFRGYRIEQRSPVRSTLFALRVLKLTRADEDKHIRATANGAPMIFHSQQSAFFAQLTAEAGVAAILLLHNRDRA
jgi:hypothetical protein